MTQASGAQGAERPLTEDELRAKRVVELQAIATELGIKLTARQRKGDLIALIAAAQAERAGATPVEAPAEPARDAERPAREEPPARASAAEAAAARGPERVETPEPAGDGAADPVAAAIFPPEAAQVASEREEPARSGRRAEPEAEAPMSLDDLVLPPARGEDGRTEEGEEEGEARPSRKRGRNRGRRGRDGEGAERAEEPAAEEPGEDARGRRGRGRGRGQQQNPQQARAGEAEAQEQQEEESRRGRNRHRDRKRGRGHGDDGEPEISPDDVLLPIAGILDVLDNYAFVRTSGYLPGPNDIYVSLGQVKKYGLRKGDAIVGAIRQPREGEQQGRQKFNAIVKFDTINGQTPEEASRRPGFEELTPLYPEERLRLEAPDASVIRRLIDLFAPVGKGTRGLVVAPPRSGKSVALERIANAIAENEPETHLMVVLVDERPEEVTRLRRTIRGEVVASTFDLSAEDHTTIAELAIERAKRLVELGHDVVVLLDSITGLGRAYNITAPASGRVLAGGVDASALHPAKQFFGAARNIENGGSLTILATAMADTGSRTDEVILEEFRGTANMELRLSRTIADRRIFPALDIQNSATLHEEMLLSPQEVEVSWQIRRAMDHGDAQRTLQAVLTRMGQSSTNAEFMAREREQPIFQSVQ
ncbi:MAG: transcription termination factor Rho [Pseudoclavibacter sp.]|nr:transcription termination factor Rho [Pseudoclavibacter sp.]